MKTLVEKFLESYKFIESENSDKIYAIITRYDNAEWYGVNAVIRQPTAIKLAKEWYNAVSYGPDDVTSIILYEVTPEEAEKLEKIAEKPGENPYSSSDPDFQYLDDFYETHDEISYLPSAYDEQYNSTSSDFQDWVESWYDGAEPVEEYIERILNSDADDDDRVYYEISYYWQTIKDWNLGIPDGDIDEA